MQQLRFNGLCLAALVLSSAFLLISSEQAPDAEKELERVKRGEGFPVSVFVNATATKAFLFVNGIEIQKISGNEEIDLEVGDTISYGASTVQISRSGGGSLTRGNIGEFTVADSTAGFCQFTVETEPPGTTFSGPGKVWINANDREAFFTNFPNFIVLIDSVVATVSPVSVDTQLQGGVHVLRLLINCTFFMQLTGSAKRSISSTQSVIYQNRVVFVEGGGSVIVSYENITRLSVYENNVLTNFLNTATFADIVTGPGKLYVDHSQGIAFFTDSNALIQEIKGGLVSLFSINQTTVDGITTSTLTYQGINLLNLDSNVQEVILPNAASVHCEPGADIFRDILNRIIFSFRNATQFHLYDNNVVSSVTAGTTQLSNGGSFFYDLLGKAFFSTCPSVTNFVRSSLPTDTPPPPVQLSLRANSQGITTLTADDVTVITLTGAEILDVGGGLFVSYSDNSITIRDSGGNSIAVFSGVSTLTVNEIPGNISTFNTNAPRDFQGPGRLYVFGSEAFYTTSSSLISFISNFLLQVSPPSVSPGFVFDNNGSVTSITLDVGGQPFVQLINGSISVAGGDTSILYFNNTISVIPQPISIPSQGFLTYNNSDLNFTNTLDNTITRLASLNVFHFYNGATFQTFTGSAPGTFPGGGHLYLPPGDNGNEGLYIFTITITITIRIPFTNIRIRITIEVVINILRIVSILSEINDISNFGVFTSFGYTLYQGSSPRLIPGGGTFFVNSQNVFYSLDQSTTNNVIRTISEVNSIETQVDVNGNIVFIFNGVTIYSFTAGSGPGGSTVTNLQSGETFTYFAGNITSSVLPQNFTGILELTFFDGISVQTFDLTSGSQTFVGPGTLIVDSSTNTVFYTNSPEASSIIRRRISSVLGTLRVPFIQVGPRETVVLKFPQGSAQIGEDVVTYEGADITLTCIASGSNPSPPTFRFFQDQTEVNNDTSPLGKFQVVPFTTNSGFTAANLTISNVMVGDSNTYYCTAENSAGTSERVGSQVTVRPAQAPSLVESYFPRAPVGREVVTTAVLPSRNRQIIVNQNFNDRVVIGCKAQGRPKATIAWFEDGVAVDTSSPDFNVTVPRPGRSILEVAVTTDTACHTYTCNGTNLAGTVTGEVEVCGERFDCIADGFTNCSVTCGAGFREETASCTRSFSGSLPMPIPQDQVPPGVFIPELQVCGAFFPNGSLIECPRSNFRVTTDEEFGMCSRTCGGGQRQRNVTCDLFLGDTFEETVEDSFCVADGQVVPPRFENCNEFSCPIWKTGDFGPQSCSVTCGYGVRMRDVYCASQNASDFGERVNDSLCDPVLRPSDTIQCRKRACPYIWGVGEWSLCDTTTFCQSRMVFCLDQVGGPQRNISDCNPNLRPSIARSCGGGTCSAGFWDATQFSLCSATCGIGFRSRTVTCLNRATSQPFDNPFGDDYCNQFPRPAEITDCFIQNCPGECVSESATCPVFQMLKLCDFEFAFDCCISCGFRLFTEPPPVPH